MVSSFIETPTPEAVLSVADLSAYIQSLLEEDNQLQQIWVMGEVSSANQHRSGLFFTLQDPEAKAAINCVVWKNRTNKLVEVPIAGEKIIVLGYVRVHAPKGQYQLLVWQALPAGEGLRALRYRQLRQQLEAEGLFDEARKCAIPLHPKVVAVVTSPQAAAWGDIQRTLRRRYPGLNVLFSPAVVQGLQAPASIVNALKRVAQDGRAEVLILSRGGGAVEDMDCFNDERIVRAIATCPIPVIAGIGHQRDETLSDLAADLCVHTPTAAAEQAVPKLSILTQAHRLRSEDLYRAVSSQLKRNQIQLQQSRSRLRRVRLDKQIEREMQMQEWRRQRLLRTTRQRLRQAQFHCQLLQQKLASLDPHAVLRRGYAVVRQADDSIVRSAQSVQIGEELRIQLETGYLQVKVTNLELNRDDS